MNNSKIKSVFLRHKNRAHPSIVYKLIDGTTYSETLHCDLETAKIHLQDTNNKLSLGQALIEDYIGKVVKKKVKLNDFHAAWIKYRGRECSKRNDIAKNPCGR